MQVVTGMRVVTYIVRNRKPYAIVTYLISVLPGLGLSDVRSRARRRSKNHC